MTIVKDEQMYKQIISKGGDIEKVKEEMALGESVMTSNLGLPIIFNLCKADLLKGGEKMQYSEEQLNNLAKYLRKVALTCRCV
jgi:hypothetical protein